MASPSSPTPSLGEYSASGMVACASIFIAVQTLVVGLRLFTKFITKAVWGWDDYMLVPALISAIALDATIIYQTQYCGLGYHEIPLILANVEEIALALSFPRFCTYFIYLRIFTSRPLKVITWVMLILTVVYTILAIILNLTVCVPLQAIWTPDLEARCFDRNSWWNYSTIPVLVFDVLIMALPMSTIMKLSIPLSERVALLLTFLAYGFGSITEIIRITIFTKLDGTTDITWAAVPLNYTSMCEVGSYIIAACIPGLRPLYLYLARKGSYSRKVSKPSQSEKTPHRYAYSYQLDSRETGPSVTSVRNDKSGESLTTDQINIAPDDPPVWQY